ncbi:VCBS repeat-containing protein [Streptomyces sp. NBC_00878]|uniref:FG-GAP repeat domain-containing protein n=1 Tax=Streptomyces sp. NBC_00878 TaxID=2975854 RepID=UPI002259587B|nr:VCBS repeat-containing protein [Streptomyces sp. NBC_00878]MCX4907516.1 VCBS repeat-containing protein [Streptomyces sp. NBC_00878]
MSTRIAAALTGCVLGGGLAVGCGPTADRSDGDSAGNREPVTIANAPAQLPVPLGRGSRTADDFNGDGHPDLVLNNLVKRGSHEDDAGIGVVYGSERGLAPGARQLLSPARNAADTEGQLPAVFDAEASCDLDKDGFTDLVVSTDPPYDGQGQPPVPLQLLFGSARGLTGKAVKLMVPAQARFGNDWPDQPVCGDFDGDKAEDLVVHASDGRLSYLRGPFTRKGAPKAAGAPIASPGNVPTPPAADVDGDGYDDLLVRTAEASAAAASPASLVLGGPAGPTGAAVALPRGVDVAFGRFGKGKGLDAAIGSMSGTALRYDVPGTGRAELDVAGTVLDAGDFDGDGVSELVSSGSELRVLKGRTAGLSEAGMVTVPPPARGTTRVLKVADFDGDGRADLVVRTYRGDTKDTIAVYPGEKKGLLAREPTLTFSTSGFLGMDS